MVNQAIPNQPDVTRMTAPHQPQDEFEEAPGTPILEILLNFLLVFASRMRLVLWTTIAGTSLALVVALIIPNSYKATALIMPPQQQQSTATALLSQLGPLAGSAGGALGLKTPGDLYVGLLGSRTIADQVIERFQLRKVYQARTLTDARTTLQGKRRFTNSLKDSLIRIEVEDHDPKRAAAIANAFVEELNKQNSLFAITDAGQRRQFLEARLREEKDALSSAEDAMKQSQVQTGVVQVDAQAQLTMASIAQLRAQITAGEVALQRLRMGATADNPEVLRSEAEVSALRAQLRRLQDSPRLSSTDPLVSTAKLPESGLQYLRLLREVKYHEFLYEMLSKQYEAARIDESRAAPNIQVVDPAVPPEKKSGPPRIQIVILGFLGSVIFATGLAYLLNSVHGAQHAEKLRLFKLQLSAQSGREPI